MTVKDLNRDWNPYNNPFTDVPATCVRQGVNEVDGCVFIDNYTEDDN